MEAVFSLGEYQGAGRFDTETMKQIENMCAEEMKKEIREGFTKIKENNADVLGVGNYFYRFDFKNWQNIKENFAELYKNAEIQIDADVQIIRTGSLLEPIEAKNGGRNE